jgi:uncharacterized protein YndB with AHSA1/START domain
MTDQYTIHKEVIVNASQEKAFRAFTEGFDSWWPRTHHIATAPMKEAILEQKLGGRWYEKVEDGTECDWGKVIAWEPPKRFALTWQLTSDYRYDPNFETEVEVTFESVGKQTRVTLEHKYLDRYGKKYEQVRSQIGNEEGGWGGIIKLYAYVVNGETELFEKAIRKISQEIAQ